MARKIKCPKCKSINVQFMQNRKKGFSVGKAIVGGAMTAGAGAVGSLLGFAGKRGKNEWHCLDCGTVFKK